MKVVKLSKWTDVGELERIDIDSAIVGLVRMGYNVWFEGDFVCFKLGNDDEVEER